MAQLCKKNTYIGGVWTYIYTHMPKEGERATCVYDRRRKADRMIAQYINSGCGIVGD